MPITLTQPQLDEIKYVSMADYVRRVDQLTNFDDKLAFTTRYLLGHGGERQQRDYSLAEAIHIAKMKIADASAKKRAKFIHVPDEVVNPESCVIDNNAPAVDDTANQLFMADPKTYLYDESIRLMQEMNGAEENEANRERLTNYQYSNASLFGNTGNELEWQVQELEVDKGRTNRDLKFRLEASFGGPKEFKKAYDKTKPGILSRMFGTSSKAYANLEAAYQAFNNPNHVYYGNMDTLDKAALQYLQHRFPRVNLQTSTIIPGLINRLSGTEKARAQFSYNILRATHEQRKMEGVYDAITMGARQKIADAQAQAGDEVLEQENAQFQQGLNNQIDQEEFKDPEQEREAAERDFAANFAPIEDEEPEVEP